MYVAALAVVTVTIISSGSWVRSTWCPVVSESASSGWMATVLPDGAVAVTVVLVVSVGNAAV